MLGNFNVRTDLALEARESFEEDVEIRGVKVETEVDEEREIYTTVVKIETENGARAMGKPIGTYITLEAPNMSSEDEDYHREISIALATHLGRLLKLKEADVLVVGLGNRDVTPDALGPDVVANLHITRHLIREYGKSYASGDGSIVSAIVPGVMAQTGMETLEIIKGVVTQTKPDAVIVVDALAARSTRRLNRTIQITDTGINPGSGVGNNRSEINEEVLGVPVIAIGVPTVVDAATIISDSIEQMLDADECRQKLREKMAANLNTMFVTPKDIDETIKRVSFTISEGLNIAFA
ncbi:MAG: GPR endopeptidase [Marvinbryantia sp.]